ncbi:MAG: tRNA dihydrouridine synthase DusB [Deltaproteobacteria bacterium]|nr:tRNA dihydrouridine synthase DusB [Deltaproteobacteria bacterium]
MFSQKPIILAPMAGLSDRPFRRICRFWGADLAVSEMISAKGLAYGDRKSQILLAPDRSDQPYWAQLFGAEPEIIRDAALIALAAGAQLIDINMGCPVRKVVKTGAGAALLREPARAEAIMRALNRAPAIPYTIKVRNGWDEETRVLNLFIEMAAEHGAKALICHPRTARMMFSGQADWQFLSQTALNAKVNAALPIIGSGDLNDPQSAIKALNLPGISGIMLGRGTLGRPWLFRQIKERLKYHHEWAPDSALKRDTIFSHGELLKGEYGEKTGLLFYRKHLAWYSKGLPGAAAFRQRLFTLNTFAELASAIDELFAVPTEEGPDFKQK